MIRKAVYVCAFATALGIALFPLLSVSSLLLGALGLLGALVAATGISLRVPMALFVALACFGFLIGLGRSELAHEPENLVLASFIDKKVILEGDVVREPDRREAHTNLVLAISHANALPAEGRVLVVAPRFPDYDYGAQLIAEGALMRPEIITDAISGRTFDYPGYLKKDGISFIMYYPVVSRAGESGGHGVVGALLSLKYAFLENIERAIPEPESALLGGILLGVKRSLGEDLLGAFRTVGLIHIVVLSGYNITIIAEFVRLLCARLPRMVMFVVSAALLCAFALMTGLGATVVRATLMGLLVVWARASGRSHDALYALVLAGWVMLLVNPLVLLHDPGFQLSFVATFALIVFSPHLEAKLTPLPSSVRMIVAATLATQFAVAPLLVWSMGEVSLVAVVANVLVLPLVPFVMALGALTGVIGFFSGTLASFAGFPAYLLLGTILKVTEVLAGLPFAAVALPPLSFWILLCIYTGVAVLGRVALMHKPARLSRDA